MAKIIADYNRYCLFHILMYIEIGGLKEMQKMREKVKMLIELAQSFNEADKILEDYANKHTAIEKMA